MRPEDIITVNKHALKPGQRFRFHCDQCGDCCRNREDEIYLNYDQGVDFMQQFRGNSQKLLEVLQDIHQKCVAQVGGGRQ